MHARSKLRTKSADEGRNRCWVPPVLSLSLAGDASANGQQAAGCGYADDEQHRAIEGPAHHRVFFLGSERTSWRPGQPPVCLMIWAPNRR
jgi:hypothetical protein